MKVLHICCNLAGSTVFPQLFEALAAEGVHQAVFVPERRAEDLQRNTPRGVEVCRQLTVRRGDALLFFRKAQRSVPVIRREMDLSGVTLLHAHTLFTDGSIAFRLSQDIGVPYMLTLRYSDIEAIWRWEPHLRPLGRRILHGAKKIVFLGEGAREKVLSSWFSGEERREIETRSAVVPNGIDPAWLTGVPRDGIGVPVRVGFSGKMNERKRPMDALRAAHEAGYHWVACGDGPLRARVEGAMLAGDRSIGQLSGMEAMKAFYRDIDVLLVPSKAETFGMVYLEAMSQGVPVLYTRGQGFDGQFPEGEVGFAVPCGDVKAQAQALRRIAEGDYVAMSRRCVEGAKAYAWPLIAGRWRTLYEEAQG